MTIRDQATASRAAASHTTRLDPLLRRLLGQAYLFDDPAAYEAGVRDAYEALTAQGEQDAA